MVPNRIDEEDTSDKEDIEMIANDNVQNITDQEQEVEINGPTETFLSIQPHHQSQADEPYSTNTAMQSTAKPQFTTPNISVKQIATLKKRSKNFDESVIFIPNAAPAIINISDVNDLDSTLNKSI